MPTLEQQLMLQRTSRVKWALFHGQGDHDTQLAILVLLALITGPHLHLAVSLMKCFLPVSGEFSSSQRVWMYAFLGSGEDTLDLSDGLWSCRKREM